jgi:hypothetical protein
MQFLLGRVNERVKEHTHDKTMFIFGGKNFMEPDQA